MHVGDWRVWCYCLLNVHYVTDFSSCMMTGASTCTIRSIFPSCAQACADYSIYRERLLLSFKP